MRVLSFVCCAIAMALPCVHGEQAKRPSAPGELPAVLLTSLTTATLLYPLDLLRSLSMQSPGSSVLSLVKTFHSDFGMKGFVSQGLSSEVGRATVMRTVKFGLFPKVHKRLYGKGVTEGTPKSRLVSAAITSVPEVALIMPLEASKVRRQHALQFEQSVAHFLNNHFRSRFCSRLTRRASSRTQCCAPCRPLPPALSTPDGSAFSSARCPGAACTYHHRALQAPSQAFDRRPLRLVPSRPPKSRRGLPSRQLRRPPQHPL